MEVLDIFSAAAGGWSLGMHRAGYRTIAACENVAWRRALYAQNNPDVLIYDDILTLTASRLHADLGRLPDIIVGSPPCQDISSANTKGRGIDGPRSGLFFEAVRLIEECRPRWFALENSANLRTRGADRVLAALEAIGYACQAFVVGAGDVGANHERKRSWIIGFDIAQLADASFSVPTERDPIGRRIGCPEENEGVRPLRLFPQQDDADATRLGHDGGRPWRHGPDGDGQTSVASGVRDAAHADQAGQADGCMVPSLRQEEISDDGRCDERGAYVSDANSEGQSDGAEHAEMGRSAGAGDLVGEPWADWNGDLVGEPWADWNGGLVGEPWADWNGGLAASLRLDDGLSAWLAQSRIMVGGVRGTSGASLVVEAFGDAVLPQIPEAIGRAIWRVEQQLLLRVSP